MVFHPCGAPRPPSHNVSLRSMRRTVVTLIAALAIAVPLGCGSSGREMRAPTEGATAPPRKPDSAGTIAPTSSTTAFFGLSSDAWTPGGALSEEFTCDGTDTSPPLVISATPSGTAELALVVTDLDTDGHVHWVMAGIDPTVTTIAQGAVPESAVQAKNSDGKVGYSGPCPPSGEQHEYQWTLHALGAPSGVTNGQNANDAIAAIEAQTVSTSVLIGTYKKR